MQQFVHQPKENMYSRERPSSSSSRSKSVLPADVSSGETGVASWGKHIYGISLGSFKRYKYKYINI